MTASSLGSFQASMLAGAGSSRFYAEMAPSVPSEQLCGIRVYVYSSIHPLFQGDPQSKLLDTDSQYVKRHFSVERYVTFFHGSLRDTSPGSVRGHFSRHVRDAPTSCVTLLELQWAIGVFVLFTSCPIMSNLTQSFSSFSFCFLFSHRTSSRLEIICLIKMVQSARSWLYKQTQHLLFCVAFMFPFFVARNVSYRSSGQICPKILGPGVFKKKANKFSWLEMFQHFCGQKCSTVFFFFFGAGQILKKHCWPGNVLNLRGQTCSRVFLA